MTRDAIRAALDDEAALVAALYGEARGEKIEGIVAVASVIRNRVMAFGRFGQGYTGVCFQPAQFSCFWGEGENTEKTYTFAESLLAPRPTQTQENATTRQLRWVAQGMLTDALKDRVKADHYLTTSLYDSMRAPGWARKTAPVTSIGGHTFFLLG